MRQRANLYRFLSRIYTMEADKKLLTRMKQMTFPTEVSDADLQDGYAKLAAYLAKINLSEKEIAESVTELEVEYARIFLAAGVAHGTAAFPYESVYTSKRHLVNQEACDDLTALYAAKGLKPREDMYRIPDDHAGLEFEYMARLCEEAARACESDDDTALAEHLQEQMTFFENHLRRWIPLFGGDISKHAQTAFYDGIGRITRGFMQVETEFLRHFDTRPSYLY